jgi:hypothetical protein
MTPIIQIVDPRPRTRQYDSVWRTHPVRCRRRQNLHGARHIASARAKRLQRPVILVPRSIQRGWAKTEVTP